jgi:hypothetical protein
MIHGGLFVTVAIFAIVSDAQSPTIVSPTCPEVLANTRSNAQPAHDVLHEAAWDNDAESVCLLLQQPDADVNKKIDKWVPCIALAL